MSSPDSVTFSFLAMPELGRVIVDGAGERCAEAGQMGAAVPLRDVVGEAQACLVIGVGPFHRHFDDDAVAARRTMAIGGHAAPVFERSR